MAFVAPIFITDVDGCLARHGYDTFGEIQEGPDQRTNEDFVFYRSFVAEIPTAACTGRSWECTRGIAKRAGLRYAVCEGGPAIIMDGVSGTLLDDPEYAKYRETLTYIRQIEKAVLDKRHRLASGLGVPDDRIISPRKEFGFTVDIAYADTATLTRVDPNRQWELTMEIIREAGLMGSIDDGLVLAVLNAPHATDFRIPIKKNQGISYLLSRLGINPEKAVYVDDSGSRDALDGPWAFAAPANGTPEVKALALSKGPRGYISPFEEASGEIDIMQKVRSGELS